jgi:tetratricopeptide (TPR) repeat protein
MNSIMNFITKEKKAPEGGIKYKFSYLRSFVRFCVPLWLMLCVSFGLYAQPFDDSQAAHQYLMWIQQAVNEERFDDVFAALNRAKEFANVSSDISYLYAFFYYTHTGKEITSALPRNILLEHLDRAIETNRWVIYNENHALLLKAELLVAMRRFTEALSVLDRIGGRDGSNAQIRADAAMLNLLALRGMSARNAQVLAQFRSNLLNAMDRFPRDPRPLRIFFEYANYAIPQPPDFGVASADIDLLELALRRLPFLLEADPNLAWMAAPFIRDINAARRLVAAFRASEKNYASIPAALNLGLIDCLQAVDELFQDNEWLVLDRDIITNIYNFLRSEEGRDFFTRKLHNFSGVITCDADRDGYVDFQAVYRSGIITGFIYDMGQRNYADVQIVFDSGGVPAESIVRLTGENKIANIEWERYPSVKQVTLDTEIFLFAPADLHYAPVTFIELGGSDNIAGLLFPVIAYQYMEITRHTLMSFCSRIIRPSLEIDGALETIYMNRGIILQVVEVLNGRQVSVTEFERGLPVIQHIDLDVDGRMETIRHFRRPPQDYVWQDMLDYRRLVMSSQSDWTGDGRYKTMEMYHTDGSVTYYFDMDGSGEWTHSETGNNR